MEQTTLQQRIEERAKEKLLYDLRVAYLKEQEVSAFIGSESNLMIRIYYGRSSSRETYEVGNDFTQKLFDRLLPNYIGNVTDDILRKIDEIDYLVSSNSALQEDLP